jgi:S-DNA-T family DNA segregation ATPase FtsK/SpoIIIE
MARKTQSKKTTNDTPPRPTAAKRITWMLLAGLWLFTTVAMVGYQPNDWPSHAVAYEAYGPANVANYCGPVGAWVAYQVYFTLGPGAWALLIGAAVVLWVTARSRTVEQLPLRIIGAFVCAVALSGMVALQAPAAGSLPEGAGGLLAIYLVNLLVGHFSFVGSWLVLLAMLGVGAIVAVDELVSAVPNLIAKLAGKAAGVNWPKPVLVGLPGRLFGRREREDHMLKPRRKPVPIRHGAEADSEDPKLAVAAAPEAPEIEEPDVEEIEENDDEAYEEDEAIAVDEDEDEEYEDDEGEAVKKQPLDPEALREKIKKLPITFAQPKSSSPPPAPPQDLSGYQFPSVDILAEPEHSFSDEMAALVREQAEILERALQTYRIDAEVVAIDAGPVITLYEVSLAPGTKVSQLNTISSDVARELKAQNIRIVPNTAGKSTVGIEVPNIKKEKVRMKDLMALGGEKVRDEMALPMYLGKDASGNPLIADLASMPHMLIAGTTGSGKSVCMNSIIMSFLFTRRPDELKLILVDPKMVEMAQFKDIPHLMCPVVTDMGKAAAILEWAVTKMDERYELLAEAGCRDITSYNKLSLKELYDIFDPQTEEEEAKIPKKLYRIVFIIDELADLMMTNKEVENFIVRIAQKARAVGIHLILATQRPQANVVTGLIKSNMPCRVAFKVASGMDSRIVLDSKGAELLLGHGDMMFLSPRSSKVTRAQGTLVDDSEIRTAARFLKDVAQPSFEPQLVQLRSADARDVDEEATKDPLFEEAVKVVLETQRGSVSLLQRRLTIGYSRASRLVEAMAVAGILGTHKGSQAREVTMTLEEWEQMREQMAAGGDLQYEDDPDAMGENSWDEGTVPDEMDGEYRN